MHTQSPTQCTAFAGSRRLTSGDLDQVALASKAAIDGGQPDQVLIFDDLTAEVIEVDFRGTPGEVQQRLAARADAPVVEADSQRRPGRPKLGVVAREVTLLPRHWEWLNSQPGGASVALRKLVEEARRTHRDKDRIRQAQEAAYRFMSAMAGNEPGYEEALRALFAGTRARFEESMALWPADIRDHARKLASPAFREDTR